MIEAPYSELDYSSDYLDEFHGFTDEDKDEEEHFNDRLDEDGSPIPKKQFKEDRKLGGGIDFELDEDMDINGVREVNFSEDETMKFTREEQKRDTMKRLEVKKKKRVGVTSQEIGEEDKAELAEGENSENDEEGKIEMRKSPR